MLSPEPRLAVVRRSSLVTRIPPIYCTETLHDAVSTENTLEIRKPNHGPVHYPVSSRVLLTPGFRVAAVRRSSFAFPQSSTHTTLNVLIDTLSMKSRTTDLYIARTLLCRCASLVSQIPLGLPHTTILHGGKLLFNQCLIRYNTTA